MNRIAPYLDVRNQVKGRRGATEQTRRDEVAALAARVDDLEEQAVELARKAIALAEEGGEETPRERLERTLAELREKRAAKGQETLVTMLFLAVMVLLARDS